MLAPGVPGAVVEAPHRPPVGFHQGAGGLRLLGGNGCPLRVQFLGTPFRPFIITIDPLGSFYLGERSLRRVS